MVKPKKKKFYHYRTARIDCFIKIDTVVTPFFFFVSMVNKLKVKASCIFSNLFKGRQLIWRKVISRGASKEFF